MVRVIRIVMASFPLMPRPPSMPEDDGGRHHLAEAKEGSSVAEHIARSERSPEHTAGTATPRIENVPSQNRDGHGGTVMAKTRPR